MRKRFIKKVVSLLLVFLFAIPVQPVIAEEQSNSKIEVTLAVGTSDFDVSNFIIDVQKAVYEQYGISNDRLRITKAGASIVDSKNDFNWTIYDHYYSPDYPENGSIPVDWAVYHSVNQPYFYYKEIDPEDQSKYFTDVSFDDESMQYCYKRSKHIYPKDDGLVFLGYSVPAYKDFMIYPDQNTSEKTVEFTIDESGVSTHTLEGAGFLFNASIIDNKLNGYLVFYNYVNSSIDLYKLSNVDANAFHNEEDYDISELEIPGVQLIESKEWGSSEQIKNIKVQVTSNSLKFYEDGVAIFDTTDDASHIEIEDTGAGGFGPLVSYRSHYCDQLSYFTFKDLTMETYRSLSFMELINQQTWEENSNRFFVNLDDNGVPEFSNVEDRNQISAYMNNNNVHYIGWGKNNELEQVTSVVYNKDQAEQFIDKIGNRGIFLNVDDPKYDTYTKGINAIAEYIYSCSINTEHRDRRSSGGGGGTVVVEPPVIIYSDIINHWAQKDIERLALLKLVTGYPDGTYRPDNQITRAEFAAMLSKVFKYTGLKPTEGAFASFSDVPEGAWYHGDVIQMAQEGIIFGYGNGTFGPDKQITREEVAAMLTRMLTRLNAQMQESDLPFKDADKISSWAKSPLGKIAPMGIIQGMPDGTFHPADNSTRAQAAVMILRMLEKAKVS